MSTLTITTIQSNLHWEDKRANLDMFEEKINGIREKTELVILPEMFSTGFSMNPGLLAETMEGETLQWMKRVAASRKLIITGSIIIREEGNGDAGIKYYNRLVWMLPNGQYGYYDKRHLFAFAGEDKHYSAANKRLIASVKGWRVNLLVCYDLRFPVWARQNPGWNAPEAGLAAPAASGPEYDLLVYVANWPERRRHAWTTLLQARAIENQVYTVGVNRVGDDGNQIHYSGETMIIDPLGETLYHGKDEEDVFTITLDKSELENVRTRFPFWKDADRFKL